MKILSDGIYYYFLSQRIHDENTREDITTKEMIYKWLNNNIEFLSKRQLYKIEIKRKFEEKVMFELQELILNGADIKR